MSATRTRSKPVMSGLSTRLILRRALLRPSRRVGRPHGSRRSLRSLLTMRPGEAVLLHGRPSGRCLAPLALIAMLSAPAWPQDAYPSKFIRIVVGYAAGGGTDVVARVVGEKLAERLGQPIVIENRPGGGARLAVEYVAKEPADGYTVLIGGGSEMAITPLIAKTGYSPLTSFVPLTIAIEMPLILLVPPDHPAKTAPELAAWAKANPEK